MHASIDTMPVTGRSAQLNEESPIEYVTLGATGEQKNLSRAEESLMQKRVSESRWWDVILMPLHAASTNRDL
jgi:peroxin-1